MFAHHVNTMLENANGTNDTSLCQLGILSIRPTSYPNMQLELYTLDCHLFLEPDHVEEYR